MFPLQPKLSSAKSRLNIENFITACRKLGVPEVRSCSVLGSVFTFLKQRRGEVHVLTASVGVSACVCILRCGLTLDVLISPHLTAASSLFPDVLTMFPPVCVRLCVSSLKCVCALMCFCVSCPVFCAVWQPCWLWRRSAPPTTGPLHLQLPPPLPRCCRQTSYCFTAASWHSSTPPTAICSPSAAPQNPVAVSGAMWAVYVSNTHHDCRAEALDCSDCSGCSHEEHWLAGWMGRQSQMELWFYKAWHAEKSCKVCLKQSLLAAQREAGTEKPDLTELQEILNVI